MKRKFGITILGLLLICERGVAIADNGPGEGYARGPWHFKAITCVDTVVQAVTTRTGTDGHPTARNLTVAGANVTFATGLGLAPLFPRALASIVNYGGADNADDNAVIAGERPGDRVQVCFLGGPTPDDRCNPDKDERGRKYRVYDYRQQREYSGFNDQHACGGI